jgi:hypothetical protein
MRFRDADILVVATTLTVLAVALCVALFRTI